LGKLISNTNGSQFFMAIGVVKYNANFKSALHLNVDAYITGKLDFFQKHYIFYFSENDSFDESVKSIFDCIFMFLGI
jgi:hypothetical protein